MQSYINVNCLRNNKTPNFQIDTYTISELSATVTHRQNSSHSAVTPMRRLWALCWIIYLGVAGLNFSSLSNSFLWIKGFSIITATEGKVRCYYKKVTRYLKTSIHHTERYNVISNFWVSVAYPSQSFPCVIEKETCSTTINMIPDILRFVFKLLHRTCINIVLLISYTEHTVIWLRPGLP